MLHTYCANIAGPSHRDRGIPCQDSCAVKAIGDRLVVAAVADGLGSEAHSDIGSRVACQSAVSSCAAALNAPGADASGDRIAVIREAFAGAYDAVLDEAARREQPAGQFDCTLCLAVFDGETAWWGQSGDSGLVVAHKDGSYALATRMQRDAEGRVYPLCFDDSWEFGTTEQVATLLLCTDGVLESIVAPPVLTAHAENPIDTRLARMFLHPLPDDAQHLDQVEADARHYLEAYPREQLDDDKTVVVVFDDEALPGEQPAGYYDGPDWEAVVARAKASLYPAAVPAAPPASTAADSEPGHPPARKAPPAPPAPAKPPAACAFQAPPIPPSPPAPPMANSTVDNLIALTETGVGMCLEAGASGGAYVAEAVKACMKERASRPKPTRRKPEPRKKKH